MFSPEGEQRYSELFIPTLNMCLQDTFIYNNAIRTNNGAEPLEEVPKIASLEDDVPYEERLLGSVLPYGVAGAMLFEDNPGLAAVYRNRYEYERTQPTFAQFEAVEDVYGGV